MKCSSSQATHIFRSLVNGIAKVDSRQRLRVHSRRHQSSNYNKTVRAEHLGARLEKVEPGKGCTGKDGSKIETAMGVQPSLIPFLALQRHGIGFRSLGYGSCIIPTAEAGV
jgi:hypothetical protein